MIKASWMLAALVATPAVAQPKIDIHTLIVGQEGARYLKGRPTLDLEQRNGAVQLRPLGFYRDSLVFGVAVYNSGSEPANFGIEDAEVVANARSIPVFTIYELVRQERRRAAWSQLGLVMLGATGSALAAQRQDTYYSVMRTPRGTYSTYSRYPSVGGQIQAENIQAQTSYGLASIQAQLDQTIDVLGDQIVQRTTVDPGDSYAGKIILNKLDYGHVPQELRITVNWNGESYPFGFVLVRTGEAVPARYNTMLARNSKPRAIGNSLAKSTSISANSMPAGAIVLRSGAVKIPAQSASGYCLRTPPNYYATGSVDFPAVTGALPRCDQNSSGPSE